MEEQKIYYDIFIVEVELLDGKPKITYDQIDDIKYYLDIEGRKLLEFDNVHRYNAQIAKEIYSSLNTQSMSDLYDEYYRRMYCDKEQVKQCASLMIEDILQKLEEKRDKLINELTNIQQLITVFRI